jgi:hypothetical protein
MRASGIDAKRRSSVSALLVSIAALQWPLPFTLMSISIGQKEIADLTRAMGVAHVNGTYSGVDIQKELSFL